MVLGFYVSPTAMVKRRRDLGLKSHPKDGRSPGSNSRPLDKKASSLTTTQRRLLYLYINGSGSITSVGEERAILSPVVYL